MSMAVQTVSGSFRSPTRIQDSMFVFDSVTKKSHEILSVAPDDFESVAISANNRSIYFTRATRQGNIWSMALK
jgi:hypothetical protein